MKEVALSEHEAELHSAFANLPEYEAADWATQTLAVVIQRVGETGWANRSASDYRRRAIIILAIRQLRATRAGMAVLASGWEVEARALDRLVIEARARLVQVAEDSSDETGRLWLERKLTRGFTDAVVASAPEVPAATVRELVDALCQDSHADPGGILRSLTTVEEDGVSAGVTWGPTRTFATRASLAMLATFAAETATLLAVEARVEHPDRDALAVRIAHAQASVQHAADNGG